MRYEIPFKFSPAKTRAALHWMVSQRAPLDVFTTLAACYFADRMAMNRNGAPIFGATYDARKFGPVAIEIYEVMKAEPLWLAELSADAMPWRIEGRSMVLATSRPPDLSALSESDLDAVQAAFVKATSLVLTERTAETHGRDWQRARLGAMDYRDMVDG